MHLGFNVKPYQMSMETRFGPARCSIVYYNTILGRIDLETENVTGEDKV